MFWKDFDTNKNPFPSTIEIIVDWLGFVSKRWERIEDKNKFIEQNLQPLLTGDFRDPEVKDGEIEFPSPALGTLLRYLGLIDDEYNLTEIFYLLNQKKITINEFLFSNLSKQRGWDNKVPVVNFLVLFSKYLVSNNFPSISKETLISLSKVRGYDLIIDESIKDKSREDILFNLIKSVGLFDVQENKLIVKNNAKEIFHFILENKELIGLDSRATKIEKYQYYGDCKSGVFKIKGTTLPEHWHTFFPNLIHEENSAQFVFDTKSYSKRIESNLVNAGLIFSELIIARFTSSLLTKPFVILTGLSGSGKTKLAQAFAMWITERKEQYAIVPVGADWTNREPLLGYPNSLISDHYIKPETGVLDVLLRANENYLVNGKDLAKCEPYFLILDEMNLSHVERYFADFLSTMESGDEIKLYSGSYRYAELESDGKPIASSKIPDKITLPKNLFIIGTVNIDETTYMFSPKVLDRANTIEFRISHDEMGEFYKNTKPLNMDALLAQGKDQAPMFMSLATRNTLTIDNSKHKDTFVAFFQTLQVAGAEFGYRTANEMIVLVSYLVHFGMSDNEAYDIAIMQKLLPKLHGSRSKLNKILPTLIDLCKDKYLVSLEKLERMLKNAEENGFASYAEA